MNTTDKFSPLMQDIIEYAAAARRASPVRSKIVVVCATMTDHGEEQHVSFEVAGAGVDDVQVLALLLAALKGTAEQKTETVKTAAN